MDKNKMKSAVVKVADVTNKGGDNMDAVKTTDVKAVDTKAVVTETKKTVTTFKIGDIQSGNVQVPGRTSGTSELGNLIRTKAAEVLKASGDAVRLGEFVSFIKGTHEYREVYTRCKMTFSSKNSLFAIRKYDVQGKEMSFLVHK